MADRGEATASMSSDSHPRSSDSARVGTIETALPRDSIRHRLSEGNRRGRLPEVAWSGESTFRMALPSHPVVTDLVGRIEEGSQGAKRRVVFDLEVHRRPILLLVLANVAFMAVGPWSTELFVKVHSWYWQPPLCLLLAGWIAWKWPRRALADARVLAPKWLGEIRARLEGHGGLTAPPG